MSSDDKALHEGMRRFQMLAVERDVWHCCLNCEFWNHASSSEKPGTHLCLKYKQLPPPSVLVLGCVDWEPLVPF